MDGAREAAVGNIFLSISWYIFFMDECECVGGIFDAPAYTLR
jgi:hypothetical protein